MRHKQLKIYLIVCSLPNNINQITTDYGQYYDWNENMPPEIFRNSFRYPLQGDGYDTNVQNNERFFSSDIKIIKL